MAAFGKSILKSSSGLMIATMLSRVLGLFRVVLEAGILGGGALAGAWQMAFMVPNLFRRLLGEGALGSAMVPMVSHSLVRDGKEQARQMLTVVMIVSGLVLAVLCILVAGTSLLVVNFVERHDTQLMLRLIPLIIPYALFICLVGVMSSALNSLKVFFLPALGALLFNVVLIAALLYLASVPWGKSLSDAANGEGDFRILAFLGYAVLLSGVLQFILTLGLLYFHGMGIELSRSLFRRYDVLKELWTLTLPGLIGAAALQISFIVDRLLAYSLGAYAVPALNYPDRLIFLPISVFALSLGMVVLPDMSREAARGNVEKLVETMFFGLRNLLFLCIPVAVFMLLFRVELLKVIYMRGRFDEQALQECAWSMLFYSMGIPFFSSIKIVVAGFQSRKDMKTPMKVSLLCIAVNIILNIILMYPLKQGGIVLATVISSILNNLLLLLILRRTLTQSMPLGGLLMTALKYLALSVVLGIGAVLWYPYLYGIIELPSRFPVDLVPLAICGIAFVMVYFVVSKLSGSEEAAGIMELASRRKTNKGD